ncbi:MAG: single-stranded DNA-binding protein [Deferribacteraceae bacterium]|jgi:single-strand DNA-binding protein|nr:single-stranded DNA-binding protein [Deferribacteraceae bacterium]
MASFNKVVLLGNVVRNPEIRYAPGSNNLPIARTALAVSRKYKDKEETMFIDIVVFGKLAEVLESYATQGTPLLVEGRLSQNKWEQDGVKRSKHEIIVDSFQLLGGRKDRAADDNSMHNAGSDSSFSASSDIDDDDIPF